MSVNCPCPYIPCKLRGNCAACMAKNRNDGTLANCMEDIALDAGAKLPLRQPCTMVVADPEAVAQACAHEIAEYLKAKPDALLCMPAGETAILTCRELVRRAQAGEIDFSRARFVALDEWLDLQDERENCEAFLRRHLYGPLHIPDARIHFFDKALPPEEACREMDDYLAREGPIDLMLLGVGLNGHLGLNEPGLSWDQGAIVVTLDSTTQQVGQKYFSQQTALTRGITLGMRHMFAARRVILQAQGERKAGILAQMYAAQPTVRIPATVMVLLKDSLVVMDEAAAAEIVWA